MYLNYANYIYSSVWFAAVDTSTTKLIIFLNSLYMFNPLSITDVYIRHLQFLFCRVVINKLSYLNLMVHFISDSDRFKNCCRFNIKSCGTDVSFQQIYRGSKIARHLTLISIPLPASHLTQLFHENFIS